MTRWCLLFAALLCVSPATAQTLQKCVDKGGAVAFRSGPCEAGERLVALREASSDARAPEEWRALRERQKRDREGSRYLSGLAGTDGGQRGHSSSGSRSAAVIRCENAKRARDDAIRRAKGRATGAAHSFWNRHVYDACKP